MAAPPATAARAQYAVECGIAMVIIRILPQVAKAVPPPLSAAALSAPGFWPGGTAGASCAHSGVWPFVRQTGILLLVLMPDIMTLPIKGIAL